MADQKSTFDRFIDSFASQNLQKRVGGICILMVTILIAIAFIGWFLLNKEYHIYLKGHAKLEQGNQMRINIQPKYSPYLDQRSPYLYLYFSEDIPAKVLIKEYSHNFDATGLLISFTLENVPPSIKPGDKLKYKLILDKKSYWDMLIEKK